MHWKCEGTRDDEGSEHAEGRRTEAGQGSTRTSEPLGSGRGRTVCCWSSGVLLVLVYVLISVPP